MTFNVNFAYIDGNTSYRAQVEAAAGFWELAVSDGPASLGLGTGVTINSRIGLLEPEPTTDGPLNTTANASSSWAPSNGGASGYVGYMGVDKADVGSFNMTSTFEHEIGHVLGFNIFHAASLGFSLAGNDRYVGAAALAEYRLLAGNASLAFIPMADDNAHWSEAVFATELMTPNMVVGEFTPLSRMTLAALRDLGYAVDLGYSDPFSIGATPAGLRDDYSGNFNSKASVAVGGSAAGRIEQTEDNDWFGVNLVAGTTYTFEMKGSATASGTLGDPYLRLRTLDGDIVAVNDNNGINANSRITFAAPATGQYYLDASSDGAGGTGSYIVTVSSGNTSANQTQLTVSDLLSRPASETLNELVDFGGNHLGGVNSWKILGQADVQHDGDMEYLLTNKEIGRWATLGPDGNRVIDFTNHSWGGDTRVVGTYTDPLVARGLAVKGSDFDSQKRFQNDLNIDNINSVLDARDYNGDGLQEIYFGLADKTAFLHAYMHADGNIQYANYQSAQQAHDYMNSFGFGNAVWGLWA